MCFYHSDTHCDHCVETAHNETTHAHCEPQRCRTTCLCSLLLFADPCYVMTSYSHMSLNSGRCVLYILTLVVTTRSSQHTMKPCMYTLSRDGTEQEATDMVLMIMQQQHAFAFCERVLNNANRNKTKSRKNREPHGLDIKIQ